MIKLFEIFDFLWPYFLGGLIGWLLCGILARNLLKYSLVQEKSVVVTNTQTVEVDNPKNIQRIEQLEAEVYLLRSREPEKIEVEKRVTVNNPAHLERVVFLEQQLTKLHKQPVKTEIVEKTIEVDNPEHLVRIEALESELNELRARPVEEKVIEQRIEVDNPMHLKRIAELESQLESMLSSPSEQTSESETETVSTEEVQGGTDTKAAKAAGFSIKTENDFTVIEGIGPKINEYLHAEGIETYTVFSQTNVDVIQSLLDQGGKRFRLAKPQTWPKQASLAAENRWQELKDWQDKLRGGV